MDSNFFNWLQYWLSEVFSTMQNTIIFRAYGFNVSLWDLYTISTTLIAFFDQVIFPVMAVFGLVDSDSESIIEDDDSNK